MFQFIYNMVDHVTLHMWDVLCIALLVAMALVAGVHIHNQRKRERDFEDELEQSR